MFCLLILFYGFFCCFSLDITLSGFLWINKKNHTKMLRSGKNVVSENRGTTEKFMNKRENHKTAGKNLNGESCFLIFQCSSFWSHWKWFWWLGLSKNYVKIHFKSQFYQKLPKFCKKNWFSRHLWTASLNFNYHQPKQTRNHNEKGEN